MAVAEHRLRRRVDRRTVILRTARDVFLSKGYVSTTMDEIAEAAGLSVGTLYLYFRNKPTLYMSLLDLALEKQEKALRGALQQGRSVSQRMLKLGEAYADFFLREPEYFQALIFLQHGDLRIPDSEELSKRLAERGNMILSMMVQLVKSGIQSGELRRVDANDMALLLLGTWNGVIGLTLRRDGIRLERRRLKALIRFGLKVIHSGLSAGPTPPNGKRSFSRAPVLRLA